MSGVDLSRYNVDEREEARIRHNYNLRVNRPFRIRRGLPVPYYTTVFLLAIIICCLLGSYVLHRRHNFRTGKDYWYLQFRWLLNLVGLVRDADDPNLSNRLADLANVPRSEVQVINGVPHRLLHYTAAQEVILPHFNGGVGGGGASSSSATTESREGFADPGALLYRPAFTPTLITVGGRDVLCPTSSLRNRGTPNSDGADIVMGAVVGASASSSLPLSRATNINTAAPSRATMPPSHSTPNSTRNGISNNTTATRADNRTGRPPGDRSSTAATKERQGAATCVVDSASVPDFVTNFGHCGYDDEVPLTVAPTHHQLASRTATRKGGRW